MQCCAESATKQILKGYSQRLAIFFCVLVLAACASQPKPPLPQPVLSAPEETWRVKGKFVFETAQARESGNFDWSQTGDNYRVRFFGPLGFGTVKIVGNQQTATITSSKGESRSSHPDELIYQLSGIHIPLTDVPSWLLGKPALFHSDQAELDHNGNVEEASAHGWQILYQRHDDELKRPKQIIAQQNDSEIRLVALRWQ